MLSKADIEKLDRDAIYSGDRLDGPEVRATFKLLGVLRYLRLIGSDAYHKSSSRNKIVTLVIHKILYPDKEL